MRKLLLSIMLLGLLATPVRAEEPKYVALTFDDGPSGRYTAALLEGLAQRDAKATFLLCGYRMAQDPAAAQRILEEGHEIGLHGYTHKAMDKMSPQELEKELQDSLALLPRDYAPAFLRPPGGGVSKALRQAAADAGLAILLWDVDPRDWATSEASAVEAAVLETVQDGDVILLHDMSGSSVEAALAIVDKLQARGFRFVTCSQLAQIRQTPIRPGQIYSRFR